jgi:hypothetical protein
LNILLQSSSRLTATRIVRVRGKTLAISPRDFWRANRRHPSLIAGQVRVACHRANRTFRNSSGCFATLAGSGTFTPLSRCRTCRQNNQCCRWDIITCHDCFWGHAPRMYELQKIVLVEPQRIYQEHDPSHELWTRRLLTERCRQGLWTTKSSLKCWNSYRAVITVAEVTRWEG